MFSVVRGFFVMNQKNTIEGIHKRRRHIFTTFPIPPFNRFIVYWHKQSTFDWPPYWVDVDYGWPHISTYILQLGWAWDASRNCKSKGDYFAWKERKTSREKRQDEGTLRSYSWFVSTKLYWGRIFSKVAFESLSPRCFHEFFVHFKSRYLE